MASTSPVFPPRNQQGNKDDKKSMFEMQSNLLSVSPDLVISDPSFTAVNKWLNTKEIQIVTVPYDEISKQGGLFRCSTLPLIRKA